MNTTTKTVIITAIVCLIIGFLIASELQNMTKEAKKVQAIRNIEYMMEKETFTYKNWIMEKPLGELYRTYKLYGISDIGRHQTATALGTLLEQVCYSDVTKGVDYTFESEGTPYDAEVLAGCLLEAQGATE